MTFYAFGVNHLRAPVEVREAFALDEKDKRKLYGRLRLSDRTEVILLSTCNRTEAYLFGGRDDVESVKALLAEAAGRRWPEQVDFVLQDEDAVRHVIEVAAGMKSLVLGDAQIFAQLKEAYRIAVEEQRVGTTMHRLMHTAFRAAKRVINETDLTTGAASIPYQAVEAARSHFESESGRSLATLRALVVGAGSMGRLSAEALRLAGISDLSFTNRSEEAGRDVAARFHASYVPWEDRHEECARRDLVVVTTSATEPVIRASDLTHSRNAAETLFVDISVPRNVDAAVRELDGVSVLDLDQVDYYLQETEDLRKTALPDARGIVADLMSEFVSWVFHHQALQPAIQAIADTFESIRQQEISRHHQRFDAPDREELDRITRSIIQKILAVPIVRLKSVEPDSIDFVQGVRLLHALFRREACDDQTDGDIQMPTASGGLDQDVAREDCPIEPQLPRTSYDGMSELDLDDVLRLYSSGRADEGG